MIKRDIRLFNEFIQNKTAVKTAVLCRFCWKCNN
nr:MAG TPA: hypothetical protein [Inoviridae sp.]